MSLSASYESQTFVQTPTVPRATLNGDLAVELAERHRRRSLYELGDNPLLGMFAFEHAGIEPDALVLSKALGGGLPLSVVVYHERLDTWRPGAHAGTFRGNQLAMAAGSATFAVLRAERLDAAAAPNALGARPAAPEFASRVQRECLRRGLILELGGRHSSVVRFLSPLIITSAQVDEVARIFGQALEATRA